LLRPVSGPAASRLTSIHAFFATCMARLEPFEPEPKLAVAVSGGADSLALALLSDRWARLRGGSILALIVDHGLRDASHAEAALTANRLTTQGIASRVLRLTDLSPGPAIAERARVARYHALTCACADAGIVHLLLGHHLADQAETLLIRCLGGSGASGMAAMATLVETHNLRLLRPLLSISPQTLREHLTKENVDWIEDPSNRDTKALRPRLRSLRADRDGIGSATIALASSAAAHGHARAVREAQIAVAMARTISLRPEGFAVLPAGPIAPAVLSALVQTISGSGYPADTAAIAKLSATPGPATLAGIRIVRAGNKLLMLREEVAIGPDIQVHAGAIWDGRFRLETSPPNTPANCVCGKLGDAAAGLRQLSNLPSAVLRGLPAIRLGEKLVAVPHLGYHDGEASTSVDMTFAPRRPATSAAFATTVVTRR
jgi:tRNA(Ile)-lysidine synthase